MRQWKEQGVACYTNSRTGQELPLYYQLYEDFCRHADRLDIQGAAKEIRVPWLICHGDGRYGCGLRGGCAAA